MPQADERDFSAGLDHLPAWPVWGSAEAERGALTETERVMCLGPGDPVVDVFDRATVNGLEFATAEKHSGNRGGKACTVLVSNPLSEGQRQERVGQVCTFFEWLPYWPGGGDHELLQVLMFSDIG